MELPKSQLSFYLPYVPTLGYLAKRLTGGIHFQKNSQCEYL